MSNIVVAEIPETVRFSAFGSAPRLCGPFDLESPQASDVEEREVYEHLARQFVLAMRDVRPIEMEAAGMHQPPTQKPRPQFGSARGLIRMAEDFDEPLADFEDYM